jgi:quercetin dioxygenase-like cupin family protein
MFVKKMHRTFVQGATCARPSRLLLAAALVTCAFGGFALRLAWATPGQDATSSLVSGAVLLDEIDTKGETDTHEIEIKAKGEWEMRILRFRIEPDGHTGWHSHPGPVFVMVTAGTLSLYQADDPDNPTDYHAGEGFVEDAGRVHIARNEGDVDLELDAFLLIPLGEPARIDEPAP